MSALSLSDTLHRLMHRYTYLLREGVRHQGITLSITQIRTLKSIRSLPSSTTQSIADHLTRDKAQITRALQALLKAHLITKHSNPQDQRSALLTITEAGQQILNQLDIAEAWAAKKLTQDLDDEQLALFLTISQQMLAPTR